MSWSPPEYDRTKELREHLPAEGWRAAVAAIAQRHSLGHSLGQKGLAPFASGSDVVWAAGDSVVKLTAPVWASEIEAEERCLRAVAGRLSVQTPEVVARGELAGWPYVVMTRVAGVALGELWPALDHAGRVRLAADLGRLVAELQAIDVGALPDEWDAFWRGCRGGVRERHARGAVPEPLLEQIEPFLASVGELDARGRRLLHTELLDEHVLAAPRSGQVELCALIDFADGCVGPPAYETAAPVEFLFKGERGLLGAYLEALGQAGETCAEERLAWALCHRFGSLARMLEAVRPAQPATLSELSMLLYAE